MFSFFLTGHKKAALSFLGVRRTCGIEKKIARAISDDYYPNNFTTHWVWINGAGAIALVPPSLIIARPPY